METGYIGLGSNQGDRLALLRAARDRLPRHGVRVLRASSVYETEPVDEAAGAGQPDFLNACVAVETGLTPERLLDACKALERELGRDPGGPRHGARPLDLDILLLGDVQQAGDRLTIPHPEILRRRFVLMPLLELDPGLTLPDGRALADALEATREQRVDRVGPL